VNLIYSMTAVGASIHAWHSQTYSEEQCRPTSPCLAPCGRCVCELCL